MHISGNETSPKRMPKIKTEKNRLSEKNLLPKRVLIRNNSKINLSEKFV